jgi:hypothetical protein
VLQEVIPASEQSMLNESVENGSVTTLARRLEEIPASREFSIAVDVPQSTVIGKRHRCRQRQLVSRGRERHECRPIGPLLVTVQRTHTVWVVLATIASQNEHAGLPDQQIVDITKLTDQIPMPVHLPLCAVSKLWAWLVKLLHRLAEVLRTGVVGVSIHRFTIPY